MVAHGLVEDSPIQATAELEACLNRVEYYQPLYGIVGFEPPLRNCRDRAAAIEEALKPLGKNFRLIDFGSSLGYFPFYFADRGAACTGVDIKPENTAVALTVQRLNGLPATFRTGSLDLQSVRTIPANQYDVGLILSVLHHITHRRGKDYVALLLRELLARIPTLVLELAHRDEDVTFEWREALDENRLGILTGCDADARLIAQFPTHLSKVMRPIYLVTRRTGHPE